MNKLLVILPSLLALLSLGCTQQQELERQVAAAEQTIVQKEQENAELQATLDQINKTLLDVQDTLQTEQTRNDAFSARIVELELDNSQLLGKVSALEDAEIEVSRLQGRVSGLDAEAETQAGVIKELRLEVSQQEQSVKAAEGRISNQRLLIAEILGERDSLIQSIENLTATIPAESEPMTLRAQGGAHNAVEYFEVELEEYQSMKGSYTCIRGSNINAGHLCGVRILDSSYNEITPVSLTRFLFEPLEPDSYLIEVSIGCVFGSCADGPYSVEFSYTIVTDPPRESAFRTIPVCPADSTYHRQSDGNWLCQDSQ